MYVTRCEIELTLNRIVGIPIMTLYNVAITSKNHKYFLD